MKLAPDENWKPLGGVVKTVVGKLEEKQIEAAWRAEGYEPLRSLDGTLISPALLKSVGRWPPIGAVKSGALDEAKEPR